MAFLKRLSDSVWSYVSPRRTATTNNNALPTPDTDQPVFKKPPLPTNRQPSIDDLSKNSRSMSPGERVGNWNVRSPASIPTVSTAGIKRRSSLSQSPTFGRKSKMSRMHIDDEGQRAVDPGMEYDYEDFTEDYSSVRDSSPGLGRTSAPGPDDYEDDEAMSVDNTLVVGEDEYIPKRRIVALPEEHSMRDISTDELRSKGWDDDYITLKQKIAMRGYQPVLPAYMKFEYNHLPDGLFEREDDAFIASVKGEHFKASKAFEQLNQLAGHVRDRILIDGNVKPEEQVRRQLKSYLRWALNDAGLDKSTMIPILAMDFHPAGTKPAVLYATATAKCRRLAARYKEALRVKRSIEVSPASDGSIISYPLPTFYAVISSHAILAIMAYHPDIKDADGKDDATPVAFFDFKDKDYDVWNSMALAILVCHVRNVQMRIADETGLGARQTGYEEDEVVELDPDL